MLDDEGTPVAAWLISVLIVGAIVVVIVLGVLVIGGWSLRRAQRDRD
jgi:heme/copper-type cytochrome/quinol oxidase subunit 2